MRDDDLRLFVQTRAAPHDPAAEDYPALALPGAIRTTRHSAVYAMHSYHQGKKPHDAIGQYIRHFSRPGELVLDPFCGSGGTAVAAMLEGRTAIALDRSPAAVFIARNYCTAIDPDKVQRAAQELMAAARPELDWLYETRCDRCDGPGPHGLYRLQRAVLLPALPAEGAPGRLSAPADRVQDGGRLSALPCGRPRASHSHPRTAAGEHRGAGRLSLPERLSPGRGPAASRRRGCEEAGVLRPL